MESKCEKVQKDLGFAAQETGPGAKQVVMPKGRRQGGPEVLDSTQHPVSQRTGGQMG